MMRKLLLGLLVALALCSTAHAQTGSAKTQSALNTEIGTTGCVQPTCLYPDNTSGLITPFGLRQGFLDLVATIYGMTGDCTVANVFTITCTKVNGVSYPALPATNTVPVVTASNTIMYEIVPIVAGGTGAGTQQGALNDIMPTPISTGDVIYWNGTNWTNLGGNTSGTKFLSETATGNISWQVVSGSGTVTSVQIAAGSGISVSGTCTITTSGTCTVAANPAAQTRQIFLSGSAATYTRPSPAPLYDVIRIQGGGAGGGGSGTGGGAGTAGNSSSVVISGTTVTSAGGVAGSAGGGGSAGGTATNCSASGAITSAFTIPGGASNAASGISNIPGGSGGGTAMGAGGGGGSTTPSNGGAGATNSGGGGGGAGDGGTAPSGSGGAGGAYCELIVTPVPATMTYTVGATASGGSAGTSGAAGGAGAAGIVIFEEHYQ